MEPWMWNVGTALLAVGIIYGSTRTMILSLRKEIADILKLLEKHERDDKERWQDQKQRDGVQKQDSNGKWQDQRHREEVQEQDLRFLTNRGLTFVPVEGCVKRQEQCRAEWHDDISELRREMQIGFDKVSSAIDTWSKEIVTTKLDLARMVADGKRIAAEQHPR